MVALVLNRFRLHTGGADERKRDRLDNRQASVDNGSTRPGRVREMEL